MKNRLEASFKKARPLESRFKVTVLALTGTQAALAADLPPGVVYPAFAPRFTFTGFYVGGTVSPSRRAGGAGAFPHQVVATLTGIAFPPTVFSMDQVRAAMRPTFGSAEIYMRVCEFTAHDNRFVTVRILPLTTLHLISAKNAPPEVVEAVLARAKRGEPVPGRRGKADGPRVQEPESPGSPKQSPPRTVFLRTRAGERRALLRRKFAIRAFGEWAVGKND